MVKYTHLSGSSLLSNSLLNKGTAFSKDERSEFNLQGLIPKKVETLDEQNERISSQLNRFTSNEAKHVFLRNLQDTNEHLYYYYLINNIESTLPLIYTPTVGYACQHFSEIWRKPRGLFISWEERENIDSILHNIQQDDIKVIVVTDGERILGLGDQGIGGMGIPIGKLSLYTACGGISPTVCLPITLDVGTNNQQLLDNPLYIGSRHKRISGGDYWEFMEDFITAVKRRWPNVLLQFEDFALKQATPLLQKYRSKICCFNDDIQGTAAVALGTIKSACTFKNKRISEQTLLFVGAGSAGCGIAELLVKELKENGLSESSARRKIYLIDKNGLLLKDSPELTDFQYKLAKDRDELKFTPDGMSLEELVCEIKPTVLIGVSGVQGLFTEGVVKKMHSHCEKPVILPLSNPTSQSEARPEDIMEWTNGDALIATGSPFPHFKYNGKDYAIAQCNNSYIFPGIGLGIMASGARQVTDNMFLAASNILAESSTDQCDEVSGLLPHISLIRDLSKKIAISVAIAAIKDGVAPAVTVPEIIDRIKSEFWIPEYSQYKRISF